MTTILGTEPTALDIIARSVAMHPSLFVEALQARQTEDMRYAAGRENEAIARSVKASAYAAGRAMAYIEAEQLPSFEGDMGAGVIALNIACKLQCLPPHTRTAAALRTWPQQD